MLQHQTTFIYCDRIQLFYIKLHCFEDSFDSTFIPPLPPHTKVLCSLGTTGFVLPPHCRRRRREKKQKISKRAWLHIQVKANSHRTMLQSLFMSSASLSSIEWTILITAYKPQTCSSKYKYGLKKSSHATGLFWQHWLGPVYRRSKSSSSSCKGTGRASVGCTGIHKHLHKQLLLLWGHLKYSQTRTHRSMYTLGHS